MKSAINATIILMLIGIGHKVQAQELGRPDLIEGAILHVMDGLGHKVNMQPRIDAVAAFGDKAVPSLVKTFETTEDERGRALIECLCAIGTNASLDFCKQVLKEALIDSRTAKAAI